MEISQGPFLSADIKHVAWTRIHSEYLAAATAFRNHAITAWGRIYGTALIVLSDVNCLARM